MWRCGSHRIWSRRLPRKRSPRRKMINRRRRRTVNPRRSITLRSKTSRLSTKRIRISWQGSRSVLRQHSSLPWQFRRGSIKTNFWNVYWTSRLLSHRELLSSYEVSKRIQSITKSQKISINGAKEQVSTGSTAKRISNATLEDYYSSSDELEDTNTTTSARITRIGNLEVEQDTANANAPKSSRNARVLTLEAAKSNEANNPVVIRISDDAQGTPTYPSLNALRGNMSLAPRFGNSSISTLNGAYSGVGSSEIFHAELLYAEAGIQMFGPVGHTQFAIQDTTLTKHVVTKNNPVPVQETHTIVESVEIVEIVELSPLTLGTGEIEDMTHVMNSPKKRIEMFVGRIVDGL